MGWNLLSAEKPCLSSQIDPAQGMNSQNDAKSKYTLEVCLSCQHPTHNATHRWKTQRTKTLPPHLATKSWNAKLNYTNIQYISEPKLHKYISCIRQQRDKKKPVYLMVQIATHYLIEFQACMPIPTITKLTITDIQSTVKTGTREIRKFLMKDSLLSLDLSWMC